MKRKKIGAAMVLLGTLVLVVSNAVASPRGRSLRDVECRIHDDGGDRVFPYQSFKKAPDSVNVEDIYQVSAQRVAHHPEEVRVEIFPNDPKDVRFGGGDAMKVLTSENTQATFDFEIHDYGKWVKQSVNCSMLPPGARSDEEDGLRQISPVHVKQLSVSSGNGPSGKGQRASAAR
ncbi:MAG: hypothetical protein ACXWP5_05780 [Bdellovibrionota bacterium]